MVIVKKSSENENARKEPEEEILLLKSIGREYVLIEKADIQGGYDSELRFKKNGEVTYQNVQKEKVVLYF